MATTYLNNTFSSPTNNYKWTLSVWVKRSKLGANQYIFQTYPSGQGYSRLYFDNTDKIQFDGEDTSQGNAFNLKTTRRFRDTNAWYHIVLKWDVTQGTASNRVKIYVNGVEEGNYGTETYPAQNTTYPINRDKVHYIGRHSTDTNTYFEGVMSHYHFTDGYSYDASTFGSTDSTTGEWKINTSPSITMGTNGFTILKDGITITDQSSNSNDWTLAGGTLTKTEDNPSNIFCTLNPLQESYPSQAVTYSFGNTKYAGNSGDWQRVYGTIGANTGKFFYEFKCLNTYGTADHLRVGWDSIDNINDGIDNYYSGLTIDTAGKLRGGEDGHNDYDPNAVQMTAAYSGGNFSFGVGDILGMAIDIDNNTFSVYKNGNLEINAYSYASASNCSLLKSKGHFIAPSVNWYSSSGNANRSCFNFGNGYFETTAISSEGTNASGIGKFEYDVPANYTAFSTKGLNL